MIIRQMTNQEGQFVNYSLDGTTLHLSINDNEMTLDLQKLQSDNAIAIDVFYDGKQLAREGKYYAVNILLPPRVYSEVQVQSRDYEGNPITIIQKEPAPLDLDAVTLQLWSINDEVKTITKGGN